MPITARPIFDCLSCDAFEQQGTDPRKGICRRVLCGQITGVDKFGSPTVASFHPPAGKGVWCMQHPMAKAFPPGVFTPRPAGETEPLVARAEVIEADPSGEFAPRELGRVDKLHPGIVSPRIDPETGEFETAHDDEPPLPGEAKPEKAN